MPPWYVSRPGACQQKQTRRMALFLVALGQIAPFGPSRAPTVRAAQGCSFSFRASISTNWAMRLARVSAFFAVWMRNSTA